MLVMMLRTVTLEAPWRWCSSWTTRSVSVPAARSSLSSQTSAGVNLRILVAQPLHQLHRERRRQLARAALPFVQRIGIGAASIDAQQPIRDGIGFLPCGAADHDPLRDAPQILDQHDAQRDGHRPQLADGERLTV